jgi:predicted phosphoribosyltransferase
MVFALPRGGVPVGYEIAHALEAPLDIFIARKLGAPGREEFGIGAVAQGGVRVLNERAVEALEIPEEYIERVAKQETEEIERRLLILRGDRPQPEVEGRTAILVDDGLATGVTARAAVEALRRRNPGRLVLAVPVCAAQVGQAATLGGRRAGLPRSALQPHGHQPLVPRLLPSRDEQVVELLERARRERKERGGATGPEGRT